MEKPAFIGMGNMGRAIAGGLVSCGAMKGENMYAFAPHSEKLKSFCAPLGIHACATAKEATANADTVILAVKPYIIESVLTELGDALNGKVVLSVVAGWDFARFTAFGLKGARVQYIMPNTPCMVGEGMFLFEQTSSLTEQERADAIKLFANLGQTEILPSRLMNAGMAISGCGPAFVAMMIEALADAGVKYGLPRQSAYRLAAQTALGTGKMTLETGMIPAAIKDGVCSPGGTTIKGVEALEEKGMRAAFMAAVKAIME